ncbi:TPR Domain containing protein [Tritrichomonas foetus]|uniref:Intraflagellar transport protein 56 n=1 Tax=Tritrichomonas foetus TaxID=1144522 RepID=A0A1J4KM67_9EUKA|nr:TPR Domain containing protein [Tritrichomonas foetus]|eukprot:OHT10892.1 TPR Domain containing protein [Tritrichomonas foetus]
MIVGSKKKKTAPVQQEKTPDVKTVIETNEQYIFKYIENRDYSGAATFIEFLRDELQVQYTKEIALWHGYALFHLGQYSDAIEIYEKLQVEDPNDQFLNLYLSSCHFYNQDFDKAHEYAQKGPDCDLKTRLIFHISQQRHDEEQLFQAHSQMIGTLENQLSLAAIHYTRSNFQDAIDIYQKLLMMHPDFLALHVYIAMCQFKMDMFQESNDTVDQYLAVNSDSAISLNLKACDYLHLFGPEIAESQLLQIRKFSSSSYEFVDALIRHNEIIFHNGEDAFSVLPKLVESLPETRFNLAVLYLRENNPQEAFNLLQEVEPIDIKESILKATVSVAMGQVAFEPNLIEEANVTYAEVGQMDIVKDTVPGRQCLASSKFIVGDFAEALRVLQTIEDAIGDTDEFCYNKGMALAVLGRYAEAEKYFLQVNNETYKKEIFYVSWLCRCYIKNKKPDKAWELYVDATPTEDAKTLLQIISTECFTAGQYFYSMKAYDVLAQFDMDQTNKDGMIASAVGVFRAILAQRESPEKIIDVLTTLNNEPSAEQTLQTIQDYVENSDDFNIVEY